MYVATEVSTYWSANNWTEISLEPVSFPVFAEEVCMSFGAHL